MLKLGRFFTRWDETDDGRAVNCTGSCSWKVYVKDGIITWEAQEPDYPTVGPDRPEYEPRYHPAHRSYFVALMLLAAFATVAFLLTFTVRNGG